LLKKGIIIEDIKNLSIIQEILSIRNTIENKDIDKIENIKDKLLNEIGSLKLMLGGSKS